MYFLNKQALIEDIKQKKFTPKEMYKYFWVTFAPLMFLTLLALIINLTTPIQAEKMGNPIDFILNFISFFFIGLVFVLSVRKKINSFYGAICSIIFIILNSIDSEAMLPVILIVSIISTLIVRTAYKRNKKFDNKNFVQRSIAFYLISSCRAFLNIMTILMPLVVLLFIINADMMAYEISLFLFFLVFVIVAMYGYVNSFTLLSEGKYVKVDTDKKSVSKKKVATKKKK